MADLYHFASKALNGDSVSVFGEHVICSGTSVLVAYTGVVCRGFFYYLQIGTWNAFGNIKYNMPAANSDVICEMGEG